MSFAAQLVWEIGHMQLQALELMLHPRSEWVPAILKGSLQSKGRAPWTANARCLGF